MVPTTAARSNPDQGFIVQDTKNYSSSGKSHSKVSGQNDEETDANIGFWETICTFFSACIGETCCGCYEREAGHDEHTHTPASHHSARRPASYVAFGDTPHDASSPSLFRSSIKSTTEDRIKSERKGVTTPLPASSVYLHCI